MLAKREWNIQNTESAKCELHDASAKMAKNYKILYWQFPEKCVIGNMFRKDLCYNMSYSGRGVILIGD